MLVDSVVNLQLTTETQRRSTFLWCRLRNPSIALTQLLGTPDPLRGKRPVEPQLHCGGVGSAPTEIRPTGKTKPQRSISVKRIGQIGSEKMRVHECVWKVLFSAWLSTDLAAEDRSAYTAGRRRRKKKKRSLNNPGWLFSGIVPVGWDALPISADPAAQLGGSTSTQLGKHKPDWTLLSRFFDTGCWGNLSQKRPCHSASLSQSGNYSSGTFPNSHLTDVTGTWSSLMLGKAWNMHTDIPIGKTPATSFQGSGIWFVS